MISIFINISCFNFWNRCKFLINMNGITFFIFFSSYKLITFNSWWIMCSRFVSKYLITFSIKISCFYSWTRCLFKSINMNYITIFIIYSFNKFITRNIFFIFITIFILSNRISIFIYEFSNYRWTRCGFLLVDMFCITFFISFCFYKFISFDIFFVFCPSFLIRNSITIFINVFCNYFWSWFYFLVDMFCITFFIFFSFYKFISFDIFFVFCSSFLIRNSITIFINVFCYYFSIWCKYPCSYYVFICSIDFCSFFIPSFKCPCSFVCFVFYCFEVFWWWNFFTIC